MYVRTYDPIIIKYTVAYKIDPDLIKAIIMQESGFDPWAIRVEKGFWRRYVVSIKNLFMSTKEKDEKWLAYPDLVSASYGLMQLMLSTAMELGFRFKYPTELLNPDINIKYGCALLKKLQVRYDDWTDAISAYNQGNNRKKLDGGYVNQEYVSSVLNHYDAFRKGKY